MHYADPRIPRIDRRLSTHRSISRQYQVFRNKPAHCVRARSGPEYRPTPYNSI